VWISCIKEKMMMMMMMIIIITITLSSLSLHCNSEITEKESYDTREITYSLLSSYRLAGSSRFTHASSHGFRIVSGFYPVIWKMTGWVTWGKEGVIFGPQLSGLPRDYSSVLFIWIRIFRAEFLWTIQKACN
jgi:hypothetical protein